MTRIIDEKLLKAVRAREQCERCGRRGFVQAAHVFGKGMGGWRRYDIAINLIGLCVVCHQRHHYGILATENLLEIVARRERTTPQAIREKIWRLRRS